MIRLLALALLIMMLWFWLQPPSGLRRVTGKRIRSFAIILLALLYFGSPVDAVPDVSPIGWFDDIAVLTTAVWWARRVLRRLEEQGARAHDVPLEERKWNPYEVLGIAPGASRDEISRAYRERMKEYHPDRVAGLGEELQRLAHEKTVDIQRAYRELLGESA